MRILFLSTWFPYPADNGSKIRVYNLLRGLAENHEITLLSFVNGQNTLPGYRELRTVCSEIHTIPSTHFWPGDIRSWFGLLSSTPRYFKTIYSTEMAQLVHRKISSKKYDLVVASQLVAASYAPFFQDTPSIFEEVEIGVPYDLYTRAETFPQHLRHKLTWIKHRSYLARILKMFQACTVVSDRENDLLSKTVPEYNSVEVIPNCINLSDYLDPYPPPQPDTLIFSGSFRYSANYDAMTWFVEKVFPIICSQKPNLVLKITGDTAGYSLPASRNIVMTGYVDDIRPLIASSWVSLAPLRIGGGTRLKILEAMILGTPVVSTTKGAEGLEVQHGKHILLADDPASFADMVLRLLNSTELRQGIAGQARSLVSEQYSWQSVLPRFMTLVENVSHR
jgi:polysaccharide biosynthesis protein PslH